MNRRTLLSNATASAVGTAALLTSSQSLSSSSKGKHATQGKFEDVINTTAECLKTGEVCIAHCVDEFSKGRTSLADCHKKVQDMLSLCGAMLKLASHSSILAGGLAKVCIKACQSCKAACKKHMQHHQTCKDCYEACVACEKALQKLI